MSRIVLRFETGQFVMGNLEDVEDAAVEIRRYLELAEKVNRVARIAVIGSADPLGLPDANRELSRKRAEWVRQRLIQLQVPAAALTEEADLSRTALRRRVTLRASSEVRAGR
jgi:outer membrane protein OmpA-like peptidoglycan-associated protein